jgi:peptidoglycan/xylan/chitin deacetylase (PgdA/CDA1 family)
MEIALKIDVDTHQGLGEGVPRLLRALTDLDVTATFLIAMGPDNAGRAIVRVLKNPGFLKKMRRTRAVSMYGLRTVLSGTLLPPRPIALAFPNLMRELACAGFEVGVHGYDHVRWQDRLDEIGDAGVRGEIGDAFEAFRAVMGERSRCFAAPGWRTSTPALRTLDALGLDYRSDTRGTVPYRCAIAGETFTTPEIPTTLPTLDEVMGPELADTDAIVRFYLDRVSADALNVHTIHAETEGMGQLETFVALVRALKDRGARFIALRDAAAALDQATLPVCEVVRTTLPGRAGWISAQGPAQPTEVPAAPVSAAL